MYKWWEEPFFDSALQFPDNNVEWSAFKTMMKEALRTNKQVLKTYKNGEMVGDLESIIARIKELGGVSFVAERRNGVVADRFKWDDTFVSLDKKTKGIFSTLEMEVISFNPNLYAKLYDLLQEVVVPVKNEGRIYTFTETQYGLSLTPMSKVSSVPLIRTNYSNMVIEDYDYIVENLKSNDPLGKMIVIDGNPGTGKTYLIRGMIEEVVDALWILVPSNMINKITDPNFIPVLIETRAEHNKGCPLIFILEDADACLVPRAADNISAISNILNFADGLFGSLFDLRIVATTNASVVEIDKAIMRPGRLCKRINVGALAMNEANNTFKHIMKDYKDSYEELPYKTVYTLAEIYHHANSIKKGKPVKYETAKRAPGF